MPRSDVDNPESLFALSMAIRQNLTDEWLDRDIVSQNDYATLIAEISNYEKSQGMSANKRAAKRSGSVAGKARIDT